MNTTIPMNTDILGVLDDEHTVIVSCIDKVYDEEDRAVLMVEVDA